MQHPARKILDSAMRPKMGVYTHVESGANQAATGWNQHPLPTPEQAKSGDYIKGRFTLHGIPIAIENVRGSLRQGVGEDGKAWANRMNAHYGYAEGTCGADGDEVDVFVGPYPESIKAWAINQRNAAGGFDEVKVMLGFATEQQARDAYQFSYSPDWDGLMSIVPASVSQLRQWLRSGKTSQQITPDSLKSEGASIMDKVLWDSEAQPSNIPMHQLIYQLRQADGKDGLMLDAILPADIGTDMLDGEEVILDALVVEVGRMKQRMLAIERIFQAAGSHVKPTSFHISNPIKQRGVLQVAVIFNLSDGQTITIWFHNPESSPARLSPVDELISWRWLLNKLDVTIVVAPERGRDLNIRDIARRIMRLAEKNSPAFTKANAKVAEIAAQHENIDKEIATLTVELSDLHRKIEVAKVEREVEDEQEASKSAALVVTSAAPAEVVDTPAISAEEAARVAYKRAYDIGYASVKSRTDSGPGLRAIQAEFGASGEGASRKGFSEGMRAAMDEQRDADPQFLARTLRVEGYLAYLERLSEVCRKQSLSAHERLSLAARVEGIVGREFMLAERAKYDPRNEGFKAHMRGEVPTPPDYLAEDQAAEWLAGWDQSKAEDDSQLPADESVVQPVVAEAAEVQEAPALPAPSNPENDDGIASEDFIANGWAKAMADSGDDPSQAAKKYFDEHLHGKSVATSIGDVYLVGKTVREMRRGMRDDYLKALLLPHVPAILKNGTYEGSAPDRKDHGVLAFHYFVGSAEIGSLDVKARVSVMQRENGMYEFSAYGMQHGFSKYFGGENDSAPDSRGQDPRTEAEKVGNGVLDDAGSVELAEGVVNIEILSITDKAGVELTEEQAVSILLPSAQAAAVEEAAPAESSNPGNLTDAQMVVLIATKSYKSFARFSNATKETKSKRFGPVEDGISEAQYNEARDSLNVAGVYLKSSAITAAGVALVNSYMPDAGMTEKKLASFAGKFAPKESAVAVDEPYESFEAGSDEISGQTERVAPPNDAELEAAAEAGAKVGVISYNLTLTKAERDGMNYATFANEDRSILLFLPTKADADRARQYQADAADQHAYKPFVASQVKMPTAVQLGLNKRGGLVLTQESPEATPAPGWSNGFVLDLVARPKLIEDAIKKYWGDTASASIRRVPESTVLKIVSAAKSRAVNVSPSALIDITTATKDEKKRQVQLPAVVLINSAHELAVTVDLRYFSYFFKAYKGCQFFAADPDGSVAVKFHGQIVGVIMPIRGTDSARFKRASKAIQASRIPAEELNDVAKVDAAYLFTQATDRFKEYIADTVDETESSMFVTAKAMDEQAKANGAAISWDVEAVAYLDSVGPLECLEDAFDGEAILDAAEDDGDLYAVGRITKEGELLGRAFIEGAGKALVLVGAEGEQRVKFSTGTEAGWSDDDAVLMVQALLAEPQAAEQVPEPKPEPVAEAVPEVAEPVAEVVAEEVPDIASDDDGYVLTPDEYKAIAATIWQQLGGQRFATMTGAKNLVFLSKDAGGAPNGGLQFSLPAGFAKGGINRVTIKLNDQDTYDITFAKTRGMNYTVVTQREDVYVDSLAETFTDCAGLDTSLGSAGPAAAKPQRVTKKEASEAYDSLAFSVNDYKGYHNAEFKREDVPARLQPKIDAVKALQTRGWPDGTTDPTYLIEQAEGAINRWQTLQDEGLTSSMGRGEAEGYLRIDKGLSPDQVAAILAAPTSVRTTAASALMPAVDVPSYTMDYLNAAAADALDQRDPPVEAAEAEQQDPPESGAEAAVEQASPNDANYAWVERGYGYEPNRPSDRPYKLISKADQYGIASAFGASSKMNEMNIYFASPADAEAWGRENGYVVGPNPYAKPSAEATPSEPAAAPAETVQAPADNDVTRLNAADKAAPKDAIFSDDPRAIEKLQLKLTSLLLRQEFMKKANKFVKKGDDAGLAEMGLSAKVIEGLKTKDYAGRTGFADYMLTNNNGVIATTRKRLESMLAERAAVERADAAEDQNEEVVAPAKPQDGQFYLAGDLVEYTGKTEEQAGALFYEYRFLDGQKVGQTGLTQRQPDGTNPGIAGPSGPTGIVTPQVPVASAIEPAPAADTADRTYLQDLISGNANMLDESIADRLEELFGKYESDPVMAGLITQAAEAYSDAVVKAAQQALAP